MIKIYVDTEEIKQQLLNESEFIHDKTTISEIDISEVNLLAHIYMNPDMIIVRTKK